MRVYRDIRLRLFLGGLIWELLLTLDTVLTAQLNTAGSALMAVANTLIWAYCLGKVLDTKSKRKSTVLALALGSGLGAAIGTMVLK